MMLSKVKSSLAKIGFALAAISMITTSCKSTGSLYSPDNVKANSFFEDPLLLAGATKDTANPFMWGVSSAGYQCEGHDNSSMWYYWDMAGKTEDRNGNAVDFLNRYPEDLDLAKNMGVNAFRLSIEWSRIEPKKGVYDPNGIQFYRNVINGIKARGMTPLVTLVHFNYPQWLFDESMGSKKGLENPDFVFYYLRYVDKIAREFGPDIKYWITFNEPNIWVPGAYLLGATPPGKKNPVATVRAGWNLLKSHSKAYDLIHELDPDAMVSSNVFYIVAKPFGGTTPAPGSDGQEVSMLSENNMNETDWFYESLATGKVAINPSIFSDDTAVQAQSARPVTLSDELKKTDLRGNPRPKDYVEAKGDSQVGWLKKFDYVAFDYYHRFRTINQVVNMTKLWQMEMYPSGLYDAIMYYQNKYNKPIIIAENGMATEDLKPRADRWTREAGLVEHVKYMKQAMNDGANVLGYYYWSITDNYEWGSYKPRFGLYTVNALTDPTLKRIPTNAVEAYKQIIQNNGVNNEILSKYRAPYLQTSVLK